MSRFMLQGRQTSFDGRSLDDGGAGDGVLSERFKNIVHLFDRRVRTRLVRNRTPAEFVHNFRSLRLVLNIKF